MTENQVQERDGAGHPNSVSTVRALIILVAVLSLLICSIRLYTRRLLMRSFALDDYFVAVALILVLGFSILCLVLTKFGLGEHQAYVSLPNLLIWLKIYYIMLCSYLFVATIVKTSLLLFIMRIFPQLYIQRIGIGMIIFMTLFAISGEFAVAFQCTPARAAYDKTIINAKCISTEILYAISLYQGILMFISDVIILVLPIRAIWELQMPIKKRLLVMSMFSFGLVACIAAVVRLSILVSTKDSGNNADFTYSATWPVIWMNVEFNLGMVAGSISSLRTLFNISSIIRSQKQESQGVGIVGSGRLEGGRGFELGSSRGWKGKMIGGISGVGGSKVGEVTVERDNGSRERIVDS